MNSEQPLLLLHMDSVGDLLSDQGGVAACPVVDNGVHLDLVYYSLVHVLNGILDHRRTKCLASEEAIKPSQQRPGSPDGRASRESPVPQSFRRIAPNVESDGASAPACWISDTRTDANPRPA